MSEDALRTHRCARSLDAASLNTLETCSLGEKSWKQGEYLLTTGEVAGRCFLITAGDVAVETTPPGGVRVTLQTLHGGDVLGWSWLIPPYRWAFDARALTDVRAVALDADRLRAAAEADPRFGYALLMKIFVLVTDRLQATRLQLMDLYGPRA